MAILLFHIWNYKLILKMFCRNYWVIRHVWYNNKKNKNNILLTKDWIFGAVYFFHRILDKVACSRFLNMIIFYTNKYWVQIIAIVIHENKKSDTLPDILNSVNGLTWFPWLECSIILFRHLNAHHRLFNVPLSFLARIVHSNHRVCMRQRGRVVSALTASWTSSG